MSTLALGRPIPDSVHAVSMSLPRWQDVVGSEEKTPAVIRQITSGYPRFIFHPLVQQIGGLPFPSARVAQMAAEFVRRAGAPATVTPQHAVVTDDAGNLALKAFWQHTGLIVSSRRAEAFLAGRADAAPVHPSLRRQLAKFYDCAEGDVFLQPTGMAAQFAALRAVLARSPGRPTVQLGFPYVDTLKLQEKFGPGTTLLHNLATIENDLHELIHRQPVAAGFSGSRDTIPGFKIELSHPPFHGTLSLLCSKCISA